MRNTRIGKATGFYELWLVMAIKNWVNEIGLNSGKKNSATSGTALINVTR